MKQEWLIGVEYGRAGKGGIIHRNNKYLGPFRKYMKTHNWRCTIKHITNYMEEFELSHSLTFMGALPFCDMYWLPFVDLLVNWFLRPHRHKQHKLFSLF